MTDETYTIDQARIDAFVAFLEEADRPAAAALAKEQSRILPVVGTVAREFPQDIPQIAHAAFLAYTAFPHDFWPWQSEAELAAALLKETAE